MDTIGATTDAAFTTICCDATNGVVTVELAVLDPVVEVPVLLVPVLVVPVLVVPVLVLPVVLAVLEPLVADLPALVLELLLEVPVLAVAAVVVAEVLETTGVDVVLAVPVAVVPLDIVPVVDPVELAADEVPEVLDVAPAVPVDDSLLPPQPDMVKVKDSEKVAKRHPRNRFVRGRTGDMLAGLK